MSKAGGLPSSTGDSQLPTNIIKGNFPRYARLRFDIFLKEFLKDRVRVDNVETM
jgi:hypothetical protein